MTRREFLATSGVVVAGIWVPDWTEAFQVARQPTPFEPRRPKPRSRAPQHWARRTPTFASTAIAANRSPRASGRCRTCRDRRATASACACWSTARGALPPPTASSPARRVPPPNRRWPSRAPMPCSRTRKVVLANADKVVDHLDQRVQARPVRGAARHQDRVPDEAERDRAWPWRASASSARRFCSSTSRSTSPRAKASRITQRLVRTYPQFSTTAADRASGDFQTRAVVDRAKLLGYEYVEDYPWLRTPRKPATRWSRS